MAEQSSEQELTSLELERIWELQKAGDFLTLHPDTLKRNYPHWVIQLSPRRRGMKFRHVLQIARGE